MNEFKTTRLNNLLDYWPAVPSSKAIRNDSKIVLIGNKKCILREINLIAFLLK